MTAADWDHQRQRLQERKDALLARLGSLETALDQQPSADAEERATEREDDEVMEGIGREGLQELEMIDAALQRIEDGEYGVCTVCGEDIGQERLDLLPHTPFCRNCAR